MISVTVLSTVKNIKATVVPWIESILAQDYTGPCNIVIIDGNSTDGTTEILREYRSKYPQIILEEHRSSQPEALNYAINNKLLTGELIAMIDGDCVATPGWITALVDAMVRHHADAVGGPGLTPGNSNLMQRIVGLDLDMRFKLTPEGPINRHPNMNLLIRRDLLEKLKFEEKFIVAYDTEFGYRLIEKGYLLWYTPDAVVWHYHRSSVKSFIRQQYYTGEYAALFYFENMRRLRGDNITTLSMILQPFIFCLLIATFFLSIVSLDFLYLSVAIILIILLMFTLYVIRAYRVSGDLSVLFLYPLYAIRLPVWIFAACVGLSKIVRRAIVRAPPAS